MLCCVLGSKVLIRLEGENARLRKEKKGLQIKVVDMDNANALLENRLETQVHLSFSFLSYRYIHLSFCLDPVSGCISLFFVLSKPRSKSSKKKSPI